MDTEASAKWSCRHCNATFDSRGKRDSHYRKEHQESSKSGLENRTTAGKFDCQCGKLFNEISSLKKHQNKCVIEELSSDESEGIYFIWLGY